MLDRIFKKFQCAYISILPLIMQNEEVIHPIDYMPILTPKCFEYFNRHILLIISIAIPQMHLYV